MNNEKKTYDIVLTSEGGGGHKSAAALYENDAKNNLVYVIPKGKRAEDNWFWSMMASIFGKKNVGFKQVERASWLTFLGRDFGLSGVEVWNDAQKVGDIAKCRGLIESQSLAGTMFGSNFYHKTFELLQEKYNAKVDAKADAVVIHLVDTQPQCTEHIIRACADFKKLVNNAHPNSGIVSAGSVVVKYTKVFTDHAVQAAHFMDPLQNVRQEDITALGLENVALKIPEPFIHNKSNNDSKVEILGRLPAHLRGCVKFQALEDLPLRQAFHDVADAKTLQSVGYYPVDFNEHGDPTDDSISMQSETSNHNFKESDKVTSIMLGSMADVPGTLAHVRAAKTRYNDGGHHYIFVFCSKNKGLIKKVKALNEEGSNVTVIPLGYQDATMIANTYKRANDIIVRSGGISIMEAARIMKNDSGKRVFIHIGSQGDELTGEILRANMLDHELGNARNLANQYPSRVFLINSDMTEFPHKKWSVDVVKDSSYSFVKVALLVVAVIGLSYYALMVAAEGALGLAALEFITTSIVPFVVAYPVLITLAAVALLIVGRLVYNAFSNNSSDRFEPGTPVTVKPTNSVVDNPSDELLLPSQHDDRSNSKDETFNGPSNGPR